MPPASKRKKAGKRGSIYMIRLQNFMVYRDARFYPGPKFNVIIGPNGSGKSSLVNAIVVGLGGDLALLERQKHLRDLVNHEAVNENEKATVTIKINKGELDSEQKPMYEEIKCQFGRNQNIPHFYRNGKRVDSEEIVRLTASYQIQTSNLCQFLPQDVVKNFPAMTPQQIFKQTLRAIGDMETLKYLDTLQEKQKMKTDKTKSLNTKMDTFNDLESKLRNKADIKKKVQKRRQCLENLDVFKKQLVKLELYDCQKKKVKTENEMKRMTELKNKTHAKVTDFRKKIDQFDKKKISYEKNIADQRSIIHEITQKLSSSKVQLLEDKIERKEKERDKLDDDALNFRNHLEMKRKALETLQSDISKQRPNDIEPELKKFAEQRGAMERQMDELILQENDVMSKIRIKNIQIEENKRTLEKQKTEDAKRLKQLKNINSDAYEGVLWLREHFKIFQGPVHEPIMMKIRPTSKALIPHLEDAIGGQELEAFICEDQNDANLLMRILRNEKKLRLINVIHSDPNNNYVFNNPDLTRVPVKPRFLNHCISDCPKAVMNHLCKKKYLHQIPYFDQNLDVQLDHKDVRKYFVKDQKVDKITSIYRKQPQFSFNTVPKRSRGYFGDISSEDMGHDDIEAKIAELEKEKLGHVAKQDFVKKQKVIIQNQLLAIDNDENDVQRRKKNVIEFTSSLREVKSAIDRLEKCQNVRQRKKDITFEILDCVKKLNIAIREENEDMKRSNDATVKIEINDMNLQQLQEQTMEDRKAYDDAKTQWEDYKIEESKLKNLKTDYENEFKRKIQEGQDLKIWSMSGGKMKMNPEVEQQLEDDCPKTVEEVNARMESLQSRLNEIPKITDKELKEIEDLEKSKIRQEKEIKELKETVAELTAELQNAETSLISTINEMNCHINDRFRDLMDKMNFAGEVVLKKGNDDLDFKNYGLEIKVKFRDTGKLSSFFIQIFEHLNQNLLNLIE